MTTASFDKTPVHSTEAEFLSDEQIFIIPLKNSVLRIKNGSITASGDELVVSVQTFDLAITADTVRFLAEKLEEIESQQKS